MVTIINYKERQKEDGTSFYVLEVQGGIEMVKSQKIGNFYATVKKATIPSTFDDLTCQALIGTQMSGNISKVECEPFEYIIRDIGKVFILHHRFVYVQDKTETKVKNQMASEAFAKKKSTKFNAP